MNVLRAAHGQDIFRTTEPDSRYSLELDSIISTTKEVLRKIRRIMWTAACLISFSAMDRVKFILCIRMRSSLGSLASYSFGVNN